MVNTFSIELIIIDEDSTTQLVSINENCIIEVVFTSKGRAIEEVDSGNNEVDKIDIINISNLRFSISIYNC